MSRRYGMAAPTWAPSVTNLEIEQVRPVEGWMLIEEDYSGTKSVHRGGVELYLPDATNTVYGIVVATAANESLPVKPGDRVVYREWEGGRWVFRGRRALLIGSEHILATVSEG